MFYRDDSDTHYDIGAAKSLVPTLPAGTYRFEMTMMGPSFKPQEQASDRYVPVPAPEMELVRQEFAEFFAADVRARMAQYGQLNKRGILLYGPPGTGKTRLMLRIMEEAAAAHDAVILNGVRPNGDLTQAVDAIRRNDPTRNIIVLWDELDQMTARYETHLLRWLDGVDSVDNILFVGCTNHIAKIPSRIYARPSRFGLVQYIGPVNDEARLAFVTGMYPEITEVNATELVALTSGQSLDATKEVALLHVVRGHSPKLIAQRLQTLNQHLTEAGVELGKDHPAAQPSTLQGLLNSMVAAAVAKHQDDDDDDE